VHFDRAADFIAEVLQQTNLMVHCLAGVSRSVSLVIAFLIKHRAMTYQEAYGLVKAKRRIIHPNDGFISQLKAFEQQQRSQPRRRSPGYPPRSGSPTASRPAQRPSEQSGRSAEGSPAREHGEGWEQCFG
jgi:dual specificity phosphatase 10